MTTNCEPLTIKYYMNPVTGSIDTYEGGAYQNESGEIINAVNLNEVEYMGMSKLARVRDNNEGCIPFDHYIWIDKDQSLEDAIINFESEGYTFYCWL